MNKYIDSFESKGLIQTYRVEKGGILPNGEIADAPRIIIYPTEKLCSLEGRKPFFDVLEELGILPVKDNVTGEAKKEDKGKTDLLLDEVPTGKAVLPTGVKPVYPSGKTGIPPCYNKKKISVNSSAPSSSPKEARGRGGENHNKDCAEDSQQRPDAAIEARKVIDMLTQLGTGVDASPYGDGGKRRKRIGGSDI